MTKSSQRCRPRIGICDPGTTGPGGLHRYVQGLLDGLNPDEFEVHLYCHSNLPFRTHPRTRLRPVCWAEQNGAPANVATRSAVGVDRLRQAWRGLAPSSVKLVAGFCQSARTMARILRTDGLDLVHSVDTDDDPAVLAARWAGVPCVLTTYQVDSTYDTRGARAALAPRLLEKLTDSCISRAIAVSHATKRDRVRRTGMAPRRVLTVHNGVNTEEFRRRRSPAEARARLGLPVDGRIYLGGVGRLHEHKGFTYLLHALAQLGADVPGVALMLAGSGPLRESLEDQARRLGIGDRVHFLGQCSDVRGMLEALDIFVLPSLCEALPYALLEAMAVGLPTVSTRVGGVAELVVAEESGLIVPPRDVSALGRALRRLVASPTLRHRLGVAARQRVVRHFEESAVVRKTIAIYRELLQVRA